MRERIGYPEAQKRKTPTEAQRAAANVALYCTLVDRFDSVARKFAKGRTKNNPLAYESIYHRTKAGLEDLYYLEKTPSAKEKFYRDWGDESYMLDGLLSSASGEIEEVKTKIDDKASKLKVIDRMKIAGVAAFKMGRKMRSDQRQRLFELGGYDHEEAKQIMKSLGISIGLTAGTGIGAVALIGAGSGIAAAYPFLGPLTHTKTQIILGLSYAAHYGANMFYGKKNIELLRNKDIQTSPSIYATSMYFLLKKFAPRSERIQNAGVRGGTVFPLVYQEAAFVSTLALPAGPSIVTARNVIGAGINLAKGGINEIWLRKKRKANDFPSSQAIFPAAQLSMAS